MLNVDRWRSESVVGWRGSLVPSLSTTAFDCSTRQPAEVSSGYFFSSIFFCHVGICVEPRVAKQWVDMRGGFLWCCLPLALRGRGLSRKGKAGLSL